MREEECWSFALFWTYYWPFYVCMHLQFQSWFWIFLRNSHILQGERKSASQPVCSPFDMVYCNLLKHARLSHTMFLIVQWHFTYNGNSSWSWSSTIFVLNTSGTYPRIYFFNPASNRRGTLSLDEEFLWIIWLMPQVLLFKPSITSYLFPLCRKACTGSHHRRAISYVPIFIWLEFKMSW